MKPQLPDISSSVVLYTNSSRGIIDPTGTEARQYFLVCLHRQKNKDLFTPT